MLMGSGVGIANVTAELVRQGMYNETLVVLSSDNGGDCVSGSGDQLCHLLAAMVGRPKVPS